MANLFEPKLYHPGAAFSAHWDKDALYRAFARDANAGVSFFTGYRPSGRAKLSLADVAVLAVMRPMVMFGVSFAESCDIANHVVQARTASESDAGALLQKIDGEGLAISYGDGGEMQWAVFKLAAPWRSGAVPARLVLELYPLVGRAFVRVDEFLASHAVGQPE